MTDHDRILDGIMVSDWPVRKDNETAMELLGNEWFPNALPAYVKEDSGDGWRRLRPTEYDNVLRGAIVQVTFQMLGYWFPNGKEAVFNTIINTLYVLRPGNRKVRESVEPPLSPTKRRASRNEERIEGNKRANTSNA